MIRRSPLALSQRAEPSDLESKQSAAARGGPELLCLGTHRTHWPPRGSAADLCQWAWRGLVSCLVLLALFWVQGCSFSGPGRVSPEELRSWHLPDDLAERQAQVTSIWLTGLVDRIDWLGRDLDELHLERTQVRSLRGIPPKLRTLDLCGSQISEWDAFPGSLTTLELQSTKLAKIDQLPTKLGFLGIGGTALEGFRFEEFPASLDTLELASSPNLNDELPATGDNLKSLIVEGYLPSGLLGSLPPDLESLILEATTAPELSQLPRSLQHLALLRNDALSRVEWPENLSTLWIDRMHGVALQPLPDTLVALKVQRSSVALPSRWPPHLRRLELHSTRLDWTSIPRTLEALILDDSDLPDREVPDKIVLPQDLKTLTLQFGERPPGAYAERMLASLAEAKTSLVSLSLNRVPDGGDLSDYSSLRTLTLRMTGDLSRVTLPEGLKTLVIHGPIEQLPALPAALQKLDLTGCTELTSLPDLSPYLGLRKLYVGSTGLTSLPALPDKLQTLDLSGTEIRTLGALPIGLRELVVTVGRFKTLGPLPTGLCKLKFLSEDGLDPCREPDLEEWWRDDDTG